MKRLIWNIKFALLLSKHAWMPWRYAWQCARGSDDSFNDGMTPREAYETEVSYWEE